MPTPTANYWRTKNGVRLSGMPGFQTVLSEQQLWQVSLLLSGAHKLPPSAEQELTASTSASMDRNHSASAPE